MITGITPSIYDQEVPAEPLWRFRDTRTDTTHTFAEWVKAAAPIAESVTRAPISSGVVKEYIRAGLLVRVTP